MGKWLSEWRELAVGGALFVIGVGGVAFFSFVEPRLGGDLAANRADAAILNGVTFVLCLLTYSVYRQAVRGVQAAIDAASQAKRQVEIQVAEREVSRAPYLSFKVSIIDGRIRIAVSNVGLGPALAVNLDFSPIVWAIVQLKNPFGLVQGFTAPLFYSPQNSRELRFPDGSPNSNVSIPLIPAGSELTFPIGLPIAPRMRQGWGPLAVLSEDEFRKSAWGQYPWEPSSFQPGVSVSASYRNVSIPEDDGRRTRSVHRLLIDSGFSESTAKIYLGHFSDPVIGVEMRTPDHFSLETKDDREEISTSEWLTLLADKMSDYDRNVGLAGIEAREMLQISVLDEVLRTTQSASIDDREWFVEQAKQLNYRDGLIKIGYSEILVGSLEDGPCQDFFDYTLWKVTGKKSSEP